MYRDEEQHNETLIAERIKNQQAGIFWMLYAEGGGSPLTKHYAMQDVEQEATRLVIKTGRPIIMLKSIGVFSVPPPIVNYRDLL